jgi:hypothetical protein
MQRSFKLRPGSRSRVRCAIWCAAAVLLGIALPAAADYRVGTGVTASVAAGRVNLACTDLVVSGTLNLDAGTVVKVRDVIVQPGGVLNGGTATLTLSRDFTVLPGGQFNAERSLVTYDAQCGPGAPSTPIPTLGNEMLVALAAMLAGLAILVLGDGSVRGRRDTINGARR